MGLNVSRLQEVGLTLGGEDENHEGGGSTPLHFRVKSETPQPPMPPSRVATKHTGLRPLFRERWAGTSRGQPSSKQTNMK